MTYLEDIIDEELGVAPKKKRKIGRKIGRAFKAIASGGMSEVARTKAGKKIGRVAGAIMTGGASLAIEKGVKKLKKTKLSRKIKTLPSSARKAVSKAFVENVKTKKAGECTCKNEMAKMVAAQLVAELGPPLDKANKALKKFELQRQATYEHQKLMKDSDFRRKVLGFIAEKAKQGNKSCQRTINCLRG